MQQATRNFKSKFQLFLGENRINGVIWLRSAGQTDANSASELGQETLNYTPCMVVPSPPSIIGWINTFRAILTNEKPLYFQFGSPANNCLVALLILFKKRVVAHYLDHIVGGYPRWARWLGLHMPIYYILRNCEILLVISEPMKQFVKFECGRNSNVWIKYRTKPDGPMVNVRNIEFTDRIVFVGAVNPKTNLNAIVDAAEILADNGMGLDAYTRPTTAAVLRRLTESKVTILPEIDQTKVIGVSSKYAAQLLPFNQDDASFNFYRMSTPSKIPNLLMAKRPLLYFGPKRFWLCDWLKTQPNLCYDFTNISSLHKVFYSHDEAKEYFRNFCKSSE